MDTMAIAIKIAEEIAKNLCGQRGLGDAWDAIGHDTREMIIGEWIGIASNAIEPEPAPPPLS